MAEPEFTITDDRLLKADKCAGKIEVPSGIKIICHDAFRMQRDITEIILPDGVIFIGEYAFSLCSALTRVYIPKSVRDIHKNAFSSCHNLTIYCEAQPTDGWIDKTEERTTYHETEEDYAFNFHRGMASMTAVTETVRACWNPDDRPVVTNVPRDKFYNND